MTQKTLGQWTERPKYHSDAVFESAVKSLLPPVLDWLKRGEWTGDESEIEKELLEEIAWNYDDGYKFTRSLESNGWAVDSELVEILDNATWRVAEAHRKLVEEWVKGNNVKPELAIGDEVIGTHATKGDVRGEIIKIDEARAQYVVHCPSLGHVKTGVGSHGSYLDYEKVRRAKAT